jgi:hypothetical protein
MGDGKVTYEGERIIKNWLGSVGRLTDAQASVVRAEEHRKICQDELGKWICPNDAKAGESFCVWFGDSLIKAEVLGKNSYRVSVRARGKSLRS